MAQVTLKGSPVTLYGEPISLGARAKEFHLKNGDLKTVSLSDFKGKKKILTVFPSLDTPVCLKADHHFEMLAKKHPEIVFIAISADLPFAAKRICGLEKIEKLSHLSMMQNKQFGMDYGLLITSGPLEGLLTRAVLYIDESDILRYIEVVHEITHEPNYETLLKAL